MSGVANWCCKSEHIMIFRITKYILCYLYRTMTSSCWRWIAIGVVIWATAGSLCRLQGSPEKGCCLSSSYLFHNPLVRKYLSDFFLILWLQLYSNLLPLIENLLVAFVDPSKSADFVQVAKQYSIGVSFCNKVTAFDFLVA